MSDLIEHLMFVRDLGKGANTRVTLMQDTRDRTFYCKKSIPATADNFQSQVRQLRNEYEVGKGNTHAVLRRSMAFQLVKRFFRPVEAYNILTFAEGMPLDSFAARHPLALALKIFWHVADGLEDLHNRGFVHADLKPQNILCSPKGRPTLIDFGQACAVGTIKQRIQGTKDFIAREQVKREPLDPRTDVFGLGATMHRVFLGKSVQTELNATSVGKTGISLAQWHNPDLDRSAELDPAILKLIEDCCRPRREDRPEDMTVIKARIQVCFKRMKMTG